MPRTLALVLGVWCLVGTACVSPLDQLESDVAAEDAIRSNWLPALAAGATLGPSAAPAPVPTDLDEDSTLAECLAYAARSSPRLEAAFHRWQAALERVPQVTTLPDPRVGYGYFLEEVETRVGPQEQRLSLSQMFPWFGKLALRGDMATEAARVEFERLSETMLELFWRVKEAYYERYYLRAAVEITRENVRVLEQFEEIARARYSVAATSYPDVVRVQVELGKLQDRLLELEDRRRPVAARLNAVLNRPADAPAPWPASIFAESESVDADALAETLRSRNPTLHALDHEIERSRYAGELARREGYPDVTAQLDYIVTGEANDRAMSDSGQDAVIVGVAVNVPIWREKYEAGVREAIRRRLTVSTERADRERHLLADLAQAVFEYRDAERKLRLFRDTLVPKGREALDASLRGYQNATVNFLDLLDAQRVLLELQLGEHRATADAALARSKIDRLVAADCEPAPEPAPDRKEARR